MTFDILHTTAYSAFIHSLIFSYKFADLKCKINNVAIEGCGKSAGRECTLKRGLNASMVVDFTPDFDADNTKATIYAISFNEKAWPGMDTDGCKFMTCPIENGVPNTYSYAVEVSMKYPKVSLL